MTINRRAASLTRPISHAVRQLLLLLLILSSRGCCSFRPTCFVYWKPLNTVERRSCSWSCLLSAPRGAAILHHMSASASPPSSIVQHARQLGLFWKTPLVRSESLSKLTGGTDVYLKLDCLQQSGSFKDRGMAVLCASLKQNQKIHKIVSSSGGNAGLAAASIARELDLDCTVVVPTTTKELVLQKLRGLGATVQVRGENWNSADAVVREMVAQDPASAYIPPYDHELLWLGHASVVDEIVDDLPDVSTIVVSVGGGGLLCGVLQGVSSTPVHVIAAETVGASSFGQAWQAGELVALPSIDSVATSLGALQVAPAALERAKQHQSVSSAICTDAEAVDACLQVRSFPKRDDTHLQLIFILHNRASLRPFLAHARTVLFSSLSLSLSLCK
jgi:L-serine/L-threonine ammonia-lyase